MWNVSPDLFSKNIEHSRKRETVFTVPKSEIIVSATSKKASSFLFLSRKILKYSKYIAAYYGKICYPRTFSFLSVPLLVVIPSIVIAVLLLRQFGRSGGPLLFIIFFFFFYMAIYLLRASHGRYLMHVSPILFLFFLILVKQALEGDSWPLRIALIASIPFVGGGIYFEENYHLVKACANLFFISILAYICFAPKNEKMNGIKKSCLIIFISFFSFFSFSAAIASSFKIGQIGKYLDYGYNCEMRKISSYFPETEKVWCNGNVMVLSFYRKEKSAEARYPLDERFPKSKLLKKNTPIDFFFIRHIRYLEDNVYKKGIGTLALLVASPSMKNKFPKQDEYLADFKAADWLKLQKEVKLKNKTLYIFKVVPR